MQRIDFCLDRISEGPETGILIIFYGNNQVIRFNVKTNELTIFLKNCPYRQKHKRCMWVNRLLYKLDIPWTVETRDGGWLALVSPGGAVVYPFDVNETISMRIWK